ncbi:MAG: DegT/DnrJ/EryC1/StrS aminotransferase family protein [bacterium]|nr:DegT/DnrJ/EryC1/StrS aminotransferase family protein [bacterium]
MRRIFTSLAPNLETDDLAAARRLLVSPKSWRQGEQPRELEEWFRNFFNATEAKAFASGRTALYAILKTLNLPVGSEVLLQAYTCVAVPDPVLWAGLIPVYVDCNRTLTMESTDLEKKITDKSRVLIIQHTFGQPADMEKLMAIAEKHHIFVIEDCAHALGAISNGKKLGSFGDAAFFSFGRDKVLSSVFGGVVVFNGSMVNGQWSEVGRRLSAIHASLAFPSRFWTAQQLMHPLVLTLAKRLYDKASIGKIILELAKRLRIISKAVYATEKRGGHPAFAFWKMPNALATLALLQIEKLERFNQHRREISAWYDGAVSGLSGVTRQERGNGGVGIFLRYAVFHKNAHDLILFARERGIELGDWYTVPIAPIGVDYTTVGYQTGSCPVAEELSRQTFNLPTHIGITLDDAKYIIETLKQYTSLWRSRR